MPDWGAHVRKSAFGRVLFAVSVPLLGPSGPPPEGTHVDNLISKFPVPEFRDIRKEAVGRQLVTDEPMVVEI